METKPDETLARENGTLDKKGNAVLDLPTSVAEPVTLMNDLARVCGVNGAYVSGSAAHASSTTRPEPVFGGAAPKIVRGMEPISLRAPVRRMTNRGFYAFGRRLMPSGS